MGRIPDDVIDQVLDRTDIVEVISSYLPLKQAGRTFKANCPFHHEKTPSFVVNPDKQIFHCFGCNVGGNVISFVMKHDRLEFPEALRGLAEKVNVVVPDDPRETSGAGNERAKLYSINEAAVRFFHQVLLSDKLDLARQARDYLKRRQVSLDAVKAFQLGLAPDGWDGLLTELKGRKIPEKLIHQTGLIIPREKSEGYYDRFRCRIMFPIANAQGKVVAFGGRALKDGEVKYINSPETKLYTKGRHLYGFNLAKTVISRLDQAVIVEGYMDCLAPHQRGIKNVVASLGTALTVEQIRQIRRYTKNVNLLFDSDAAGQAAMMRSIETLIEEGMTVTVTSLPTGEDPDSFLTAHGEEAFQERIDNAVSIFDFKLGRLTAQYDIERIEDKAAIAEEMLLTISKFTNAVIRAGYIQKLSREIQIPEKSLLVELNKIEGIFSKQDIKKELGLQPSGPVKMRPVESGLLRLMLSESRFISSTRNEVEVSDFQDERVKHIVTKIYELFDQGKDITTNSLLGSFDNRDIQEIVSRLVVEEDLVKNNKEKYHRDCLIRMKQDRLKNTRQTLLQQIKEAEESGDHEKVEDLKYKFFQTIKTINRTGVDNEKVEQN